MSKRALSILFTIAAIVTIVIAWQASAKPERETVIVERGSIDVTIDTVGTIQRSTNDVVRTSTAGTVAAIGAEEGDTVVAGDIIALLDDAELENAVRETERALEAAEFSLQFAELRLSEDSESVNLQQEAIIAEERVTAAELAVQEAIERRRAGAILAGRDGMVLRVLVAPGDRVADQQPVAEILGEGELVLIADVDELDLPNVKLGANARFRLDSDPSTEIEGVVLNTAPQAIQRGGATLFPTKIVFTTTGEEDIRPGMNAEVTIQTELREDVLLVPEQAIRTVGRRAFVTTIVDGEEVEVEVILGYRAMGMAEVVSGLDEGQTVLID